MKAFGIENLTPAAVPHERYEEKFKAMGLPDPAIDELMSITPGERNFHLDEMRLPGDAAHWQIWFALHDGPRSPTEAARQIQINT